MRQEFRALVVIQELVVIVDIQDRALAVFQDIQEVEYQAYQAFQDIVARVADH